MHVRWCVVVGWLVCETRFCSLLLKSQQRASAPAHLQHPSFLYGSQLEPRHVSGTWARSIRAPLASLAHQLTHSQRNCFAKDEWAERASERRLPGRRVRFLPDNPSLPSATENIMQAKINERGRNYIRIIRSRGKKSQGSLVNSSFYSLSVEIQY
jgi:hypothetical protein